jgi:hypothetical protein
MIIDSPLYAQAQAFNPVDGLNTIYNTQRQLNGAQFPSPTGQNAASISSAVTPSRPRMTLLVFLKNRFFGKTLAMSNGEHNYVGQGIVIGIEKEGHQFFAKMIDPNTETVFRAQFIFERELFGETGRDALQTNSRATPIQFDAEQRLNGAVAPLLDRGNSSIITPPTTDSPTQLSEIPGEEIEVYSGSTKEVEMGTLVFVKGKPYFRENGLPLFIRLEPVQNP